MGINHCNVIAFLGCTRDRNSQWKLQELFSTLTFHMEKQFKEKIRIHCTLSVLNEGKSDSIWSKFSSVTTSCKHYSLGFNCINLCLLSTCKKTYPNRSCQTKHTFADTSFSKTLSQLHWSIKFSPHITI